MAAKFKVLLLAYMIAADRGSEYSVAWNFLTAMSSECDITVLYGTSGDHLGEFRPSALTAALPLDVRFIPVQPDNLALALNWPNKHGLFNYSFYLAYRRWHQLAHRKAQELLAKESFDLVHYLGPIGYREPGFLYKLNLPYVWGPIGGAPNYPISLAPALRPRDLLKLSLRSAVNFVQLRFSRRVREAIRRADVLLTATSENQAIFRRVHNRDSVYLPENGPISTTARTGKRLPPSTPLILAWIGRLEGPKGLILLIDALRHVSVRGKFHVNVIGLGPESDRFQHLVSQHGIADEFTWHGHVSRDEVLRLLESSHIHVITSLKEGNPTTLWEALSLGVPVVTLDHCGMRDTITERCGLKVPVQDYAGTVCNLRRELLRLAENPELIELLSRGCDEQTRKYEWAARRDVFLEQYSIAISAWNKANPTSG